MRDAKETYQNIRITRQYPTERGLLMWDRENNIMNLEILIFFTLEIHPEVFIVEMI